MRIALVAPGFSARPDDWAIPALLNLARALAETHEVHIFSQRYPARGVYQFDGLTHHALGGGQRFGLISFKIWLQTGQMIKAQHQKTPFDLLHSFWIDEAGFSAALTGAWIKRPVVASIGGGELVRLPAIAYGAQRFLTRRLAGRYALRRASLVTAGSRYQLALCRAYGVAEQKLRYSPLGVDTGRFRPATQPPAKSPPSLIQAASLLPVKNQALLLHILRRVKNHLPDITLNLVGSGPEQERLVKLAQRLDLSQNITWHGHIPHPEMPPLYQQSQLYLQTSWHESQGLAVLEAMACGLPVLGTPVGLMPEVACLPPQINPDLLADQVITLLTDAQSYQHDRNQARQIAETLFSLPVTVENFNQIYIEVVEKFHER
jgi:glycosyltransferase involved in cell wall biosynthesis